MANILIDVQWDINYELTVYSIAFICVLCPWNSVLYCHATLLVGFRYRVVVFRQILMKTYDAYFWFNFKIMAPGNFTVGLNSVTQVLL